MSKKITFPCMKDTLGEVSPVVMKTPKGVLNRTLKKWQEMAEKFTSIAAKSKTTSHIQREMEESS